MMILITRITSVDCTCICIFLYEELFCICCETRRLCVCIISTIIAGVSFIICGKLYFRIFFREFVFSSDGVDFAGCSCIMQVYANVWNIFLV